MIEVAGLTKVYGASVALRRVSLTVPAGAVLTVLGPNGSGKTTLLRLLATLIRPTAGGGRIGGYDLVADRDAVRRLVGLIGHGTQLYDDLTPAENLAFAATLDASTSDPDALGVALARMGVDAQGPTRVRELSSGMRRRVALARVMLRRPRVLLLDEPFAGLDHDGRKRLDEYLHEFKAAGGAAVLVTHSVGRGLALADRVAILAGGRLVVDQPRESLTPDALERLYLAATDGEA
ncbi:MAG TPA: heme ABC exporter ATP-binding protein CcmA [Methylomirabilota bacterium]|jgi:heme exporter protein A|nr:heme ABC exporter ATP-binding protein CcmA [Methylomirabilota bacterium]